MAWPKGKPRKPNVPDLPEVFIPDSVLPRQVRWDGYGAIRPWIARYAAKEHGCILSQCSLRYDPKRKGFLVRGPQREVPMAITRQRGELLCACGTEVAVWWLLGRDGQRELEVCPEGWEEVEGSNWLCPQHQGAKAVDTSASESESGPLLPAYEG